MEVVQYKYYLYKGILIARLEKEKWGLEPKEWFLDGVWQADENLDRDLNDCIMDFEDSRWYEYTELGEQEAIDFILKYQQSDKNKIKGN